MTGVGSFKGKEMQLTATYQESFLEIFTTFSTDLSLHESYLQKSMDVTCKFSMHHACFHSLQLDEWRHFILKKIRQYTSPKISNVTAFNID